MLNRNQSNAETQSWITEIEDSGAIVLPCDDYVLVVDSCRPWSAIVAKPNEPDVVIRLKDHSLRMGRSPRLRREILYVGAWPAPDEANSAIIEMAAKGDPRTTYLRVFFTGEADLIQGLEKLAGPNGRCTVRFFGQAPELSEEDLSTLLRRGASLTHTCGWPVDKSQPGLDHVTRLSELGLRIPVTIYVHKDNLSGLIEFAHKCLQSNYNAGVAFEPACAHPAFTLSDASQLPDAREFSELLVDAYEVFRHYDEVFEPIVSLVRNLQLGGWDPLSENDLPVRFRIDETGTVQRFRQLPWSSGDPAFAGSVGEEPVPLSETCNSCRWKEVCGGCEKTDDNIFDLICNYRMLFLEYFVREMHFRKLEFMEH